MRELWEEIWQTLRRNKWRSLMTAFGVFWGILMLVLLVGLGNGVSRGITDAVKTVPANSVLFGGAYTSLPYKGMGKDRSVTMENEDLELLKANLGDRVKYITPVNGLGNFTANVGERNISCSMMGTTPSYYHVIASQMMYGRYLNEVDVRERRKVCVIGKEVYETLFTEGTDPCGELVKVGEIYYTIVGVVKKLSDMVNMGTDTDEAIILPFTTAQLSYGQGNAVYMTIVTLHDEYSVKEWEDRILAIVKEHHMVHPDDKQAFWSFNLAEIISMFDNLFLGISILLWIVGCGSLFAGLIGISNIMLVTVKERTQEIGIRRALGAKPATILTQIMSESLVLTIAAGLTGLMLGVWILNLVGLIIEAMPDDGGMPMSDPQVEFSVAIGALIVIIIGGLLAGMAPARHAMKIRAIEALREE